MKAVGKLFWAILAVFLFCFALLAVNQSQVALEFLVWRTPEISMFWWLLLAFLLGVLLSTFGFAVATMRTRMRQRALNKELDASRREIDKLRNLTLQD